MSLLVCIKLYNKLRLHPRPNKSMLCSMFDYDHVTCTYSSAIHIKYFLRGNNGATKYFCNRLGRPVVSTLGHGRFDLGCQKFKLIKNKKI